MLPAQRYATYDDLLALPEGTRAEVIAGQIEMAPSPLPEHNLAASVLSDEIGLPFHRRHGRGGPGGWWIFTDIDVRLGPHDIVRPNVVGWRRERLPEPWGMRPIDVVPDWVCEILSPSNAAHDRVTKANLYAERHVPFFWLVDPIERVLETFRLVDGLWMRLASYDDTAKVRIAPFEEVELEVGLLFPPKPDGR